MRSGATETKRRTKGSGVWTTVGWLVFAIPFCLYIILQLAFGADLGVTFAA